MGQPDGSGHMILPGLTARLIFHRSSLLLTQTLGELGRVGGNINQLTRRANAGKLSGHDAELAASLAELDALRGRLREIIR